MIPRQLHCKISSRMGLAEGRQPWLLPHPSVAHSNLLKGAFTCVLQKANLGGNRALWNNPFWNFQRSYIITGCLSLHVTLVSLPDYKYSLFSF